MSFGRTPVQLEIMGYVLSAADAGDFISFQKLMTLVKHKPSKGALLSSMKILAKYGFIDREYRRFKGERNARTFYLPTPKAYSYFRKM